MVQNPIKIYTLSTCSSCKALKNKLKTLDIPFEAVDVDLLPKDEQARITETIKTLSHLVAFPTTIVGDKVIVGFKEKEIVKAIKRQGIPKPNPIKQFFAKLFGNINPDVAEAEDDPGPGPQE
jgi:glutaredoxin-like protein NrdH